MNRISPPHTKRNFLLILSLFVIFNCYAQNKTDSLIEPRTRYEDVRMNSGSPIPDQSVYTVVDLPPSFPGGPLAFREFIAEKVMVVVPAVSGTVYYRVTIEADGTISSPFLVKNIFGCKYCESESLKIIRAMPKWIPGELQGKKVKCFYNLPIKFDQK
jgi:hypothetical protein